MCGFERHSVYLRLSVTDRCNLRCRYCRPNTIEGYARSPAEANDEELLSIVRIVEEENSIEKLRLTGGEPLVYPLLSELLARLRHLLPHARLCLTTNGTLLARKAEDLKTAGLDALNVSLDTLNAALFRDLTGGGSLESTIAGISAVRKAGFTNLKLNAVLVRSFNADQLSGLVRFASELDCEIRFIELMPYGQGAALFSSEYLAADQALGQLSREFPCAGPLAPRPPRSDTDLLSTAVRSLLDLLRPCRILSARDATVYGSIAAAGFSPVCGSKRASIYLLR